MKRMIDVIVRSGQRLPAAFVLVLVVGLNVVWWLVLQLFGRYFERVSGQPILDLVNVNNILSPAAAAALVNSYSVEAERMYWQFFVLDNVMPPLVFGVFALLWVAVLRGSRRGWIQRVLYSPLLLIPFGVGVFDWLENICFVTAVSASPTANVLPWLQVGLAFTYVKAGFLFATFLGTGVLLILRAADWAWLRVGRRMTDVQISSADGNQKDRSGADW